MTTLHPCESIRNRLLAEADPLRVPADLKPHVTECAGCRAFLARYRALALDLKALPAPDSELKKLEFTQMLESDGPIIRSIPSTLAHSWFSPQAIFARVAKPLLATAAAVAVGLGVWSVIPGKRPVTVPEYARHELLGKLVKHNATLAQKGEPDVRLRTLAAIARDLETETARVALAANFDDLDTLATLYDKVVKDGLVKQADTMNKFDPGLTKMLNDAATSLEASSLQLLALQKSASTLVKPVIGRMEATAANSGRELRKLAGGGA
jgi:hypothetical protein